MMRGARLVVHATVVAVGVCATAAQSVEAPTPLELRKPIARGLSGADAHTYQLTLRAGDYAPVTVEQRGVDVVVRTLAARAVQLAEQEADPTDAYLGSLLTKLGELQRTTADTTAAEQTLKRAIAIDEAALGRDDPQTAFALLRLAALYNATEDYPQADPLAQQALAITEKTLGSAHPRITTCLLVASLIHSRREDYERAIPELQRALGIAEQTSNPDDYSVLAIVNNLGDLYSLLKDFD